MTRRLRIPPTLRLVLLLPLLAAGVDVTRATLACGVHAQTCLEAAGRGWMGAVAVALVPLYAAAFGVALAVAARGRHATGGPAPSFARLWAMGIAAMGAAAAGQMGLAALLDGGAPLGGSPVVVAILCVAAGAVLALAMRAVEAARELRPQAVRALPRLVPAACLGAGPAVAAPWRATAPARGRGPPAG